MIENRWYRVGVALLAIALLAIVSDITDHRVPWASVPSPADKPETNQLQPTNKGEAKETAEPIMADGAAWKLYMDAGINAYGAGDYSEAVRQLETALGIAEGFGDRDTRLAEILTYLALSYEDQRRYGDAKSLIKRALAIYAKASSPEHPDLAVGLNNLAWFYEGEGRYEEAEPLFRRALVIEEKVLGPEHPEVAASLNNLAWLYDSQGRYEEADLLFRRALVIEEKVLGPEHPDVVKSLNNLAWLYDSQGRYAEAVSLYRRVLAIREKTLGSEHPDVVKSLNNLAVLYQDQGRYGEAEPLYRRLLTVREKTLGPEHPDMVKSLNNLAGLYKHQEHYAEAGPLYRRALEIREKALGPEHPDVVKSLNNLAGLYSAQGYYEKARPLYQRALAKYEKSLGSESLDVVTGLGNLAARHLNQGRYAETEPYYQRALVQYQNDLGSEHPDIATILTNLAALYEGQGRYTEVGPLYRRALAIYEKALGSVHPDVAMSLNKLAELYVDQGRYEEAEPLYLRALAISEKALGSEHPDVAFSLCGLAGLYRVQGRYGEAERLYRRALEINEQAPDSEYPPMATSLSGLATLFSEQGRYAEAGSLYRRALEINEKALGYEHPDVAKILNKLAGLHGVQGRTRQALEQTRRATAIHRARALRAAGGRPIGASKERQRKRYVFTNHISLLHKTAETMSVERLTLAAEGFEVGQLALKTSAAEALVSMAARYGAGNDTLARLVRKRQDALERWHTLDAELVKDLGYRPSNQDAVDLIMWEEWHYAPLQDLEEKIQRLDKRLASEFPEYFELSYSRPLTLDLAQSLLGADEALLFYLVGKDESFIWVVRREAADFHRLEIGRKELTEKVKALREGLEPRRVKNLKDLGGFSLILAHEMYKVLLAPAEPLLTGTRHLMVVPDGPLSGLPFAVLVSKTPPRGITDYRDYPQVDWLARRYALTTLPAVSSLRALRRFAGDSLASEPFSGFGDPVLEGKGAGSRGPDLALLFPRGAIADVDAVRRLAPLPDTATELRAVARALGAGDEHLYLGEQATETRVKSLDLSRYRTLAFATHGLMAGEFKGLAEPALVLTPPEAGTPEDDGLLTASEAAQLKLNADWVILSACNTASPDGAPGAEGLSGLARAFFYAGSRALLVSHWQVDSDAAVRLTTGLFDALGEELQLGRAEALRRSMLALMNDSQRPYYRHPIFWAPFMVVGEGG